MDLDVPKPSIDGKQPGAQVKVGVSSGPKIPQTPRSHV